jgi:hypothetical protein
MAGYAAVEPLAALPAARADQARRRAVRLWAVAVCLSAFGPYVGSARLEQVAALGSAALVLTLGWSRMMAAVRVPSPWPLILLAGICGVTLIGTVSRPLDPDFYGAQSAVHGLMYFLLPLALVIVTWYWTLIVPAADLVVVVAKTTILAMSVNAAIAVAQMASGNAVVLGFLPRFWATSQSGEVALRAAENFRYTGVFDQPAEAGVAYGLTLLCVIFLVQRGSRRPILLALCAAVVVAGGVLSLSKVFLLGAPPSAMLVVLHGRGRVRILAGAAGTGAGFWLLAWTGILPGWAGGAALDSLADPAVTAWGGGRYGTAGTLGSRAADVLHASPWYGFGAQGLAVAYDSLWIEALILAGVCGVILVTLLLACLGWQWLALRDTLSHPEWRLAGASLALAAGASLGLPSLTADRAGTLLWLVLGLLVCARRPAQIRELRPGTPIRCTFRITVHHGT